MSPDRRPLVAVGIAAVAVAAVTVAILLFGYIPLPSFPSLAEQPDPSIPGTVAFVRWGDDGSCIMVVPASGGEPREVACQGRDHFIEGHGGLAWTPDGRLLVHGWGEFSGPVVSVLDPESGTELDRIPLEEPSGPDRFFEGERERTERSDGARVTTARFDRPSVGIRLPDGETRVLYEADEAPRNYSFFAAQWSPDGDWVLVRDSEQRLIVLAADGDPGPRVLATDAEGAAWYVPGNPTYTVDPAEVAG